MDLNSIDAEDEGGLLSDSYLGNSMPHWLSWDLLKLLRWQ